MTNSINTGKILIPISNIDHQWSKDMDNQEIQFVEINGVKYPKSESREIFESIKELIPVSDTGISVEYNIPNKLVIYSVTEAIVEA